MYHIRALDTGKKHIFPISYQSVICVGIGKYSQNVLIHILASYFLGLLDIIFDLELKHHRRGLPGRTIQTTIEMMQQSEEQSIRAMRSRLLAWFEENQRPLPWRQSYHPYQVWIAEIMGQQTQMERVAEYFSRWMQLFPDVASLAHAPEQAVLKAWEGLGYYSRAHNIRRTAQILLEHHSGCIPEEQQALLALPGIGPYTAAAILSIGFNQPCPLVDANVERVFARLHDLEEPVKGTIGKKTVQQLAALFLDRDAPRAFNQALMELGALVCTPKNPNCSSCPLQHDCLASSRGTVALRPVLSKRPGRIDIIMACGIIKHNGLLYIQQRLADDIWGGLWEFPGGRLEGDETPAQAVLREILEETGWRMRVGQSYHTVIHYYTRYRVTLHSFFCNLEKGQSLEPSLNAASHYAWVDAAAMLQYPFPSGHRQLVAALNEK